jgi:hypothetical protein
MKMHYNVTVPVYAYVPPCVSTWAQIVYASLAAVAAATTAFEPTSAAIQFDNIS